MVWMALRFNLQPSSWMHVDWLIDTKCVQRSGVTFSYQWAASLGPHDSGEWGQRQKWVDQEMWLLPLHDRPHSIQAKAQSFHTHRDKTHISQSSIWCGEGYFYSTVQGHISAWQKYLRGCTASSMGSVVWEERVKTWESPKGQTEMSGGSHLMFRPKIHQFTLILPYPVTHALGPGFQCSRFKLPRADWLSQLAFPWAFAMSVSACWAFGLVLNAFFVFYYLLCKLPW